MTSNLSACDQVWLVGAAGATLHSTNGPESPLITLHEGAPPVNLVSLRVLGKLKVEGGELSLTDCSVALESSVVSHGRRMSAQFNSSMDRALSITGARVVLARTTLAGVHGGAIDVMAASLILMDCTFRDSHSDRGGALLVYGGSVVAIQRSWFADNRASVSGGALLVSGGANVTIEKSTFASNSANVSGGALQVRPMQLEGLPQHALALCNIPCVCCAPALLCRSMVVRCIS